MVIPFIKNICNNIYTLIYYDFRLILRSKLENKLHKLFLQRNTMAQDDMTVLAIADNDIGWLVLMLICSMSL